MTFSQASLRDSAKDRSWRSCERFHTKLEMCLRSRKAPISKYNVSSRSSGRVSFCVEVYDQTDRQTDRQTASQPASQTDRQTDSQVGRQAGRQTDRQTEQRTCMVTHFTYAPVFPYDFLNIPKCLEAIALRFSGHRF